MGRVVRNPEIHVTQNGKKIAKFTVADNRYYRDANDEKQRETAYADFEAFAGKADYVEKNLQEGEPVCVEGRMRNDVWVGKDEKKHSRVVFVAENFNYVPRNNREGQSQNSNS